jgi:hypothetical protein
VTDKYILNDAGEAEPCTDLHAWAVWFETADRVVKKTRLGGDVKVSTVFLSLDHSFGALTGGKSVPILWETMIFGGPHDGYQARYTSRTAAIRHHETLVAALRTQVPDEDAEPVPLPEPEPRRRINLGG